MKQPGARIVVVLGMHRSGTSLITRGLQVLGVSLGDRLMPPADGNNAKGFFEDIDINELNIAMLAALGSDWQSIRPLEAADFDKLRREGWAEKARAALDAKAGQGAVFGFKDPRVAKLLPFWKSVLGDGRFTVKYLLALRNPASVTESLVSRDGMPRERSYYLWLEHVLASLEGTIDRAPVLVDYDDFFGDADRVLGRMATGLGLTVDVAERDRFKNEFIDDGLRHTVHSLEDLSSDPTCPPLVREVYVALKAVSLKGGAIDSPQLRKSLGRWKAEFDRMGPALRLADARPVAVVQAAPEAAGLEILKAVGRHDPSFLRPAFNQEWYGLAYPDVLHAGLDPYVHYSESGVHEGRHPGPDVAHAAQQALGALVGGRESSAELVAQARRDGQRWADMMELQRSFQEREGKLTEQLQLTQSQLHASQERRAEREAAWVSRERETAQAVEEAAQRQAAALDALRGEGAQREQALAARREALEAELRDVRAKAAAREAADAAALAGAMDEAARRQTAALDALRGEGAQREQALAAGRDALEAELRDVRAQAAAREAAHAAALAVMEREQAERLAALDQEAQAWQAQHQQALADAQARQVQHQQALAAAQAHGETVARRFTAFEKASQQQVAALETAHAAEIARLGSERQAFEAALRGEHAAAEAALRRERDAAEAALRGERDAAETALRDERDERDAAEAALRDERDAAEAALRGALAQASAAAESARVRAEQERAALENTLAAARSELDAIHGSLVWRALAPLRGGGKH